MFSYSRLKQLSQHAVSLFNVFIVSNRQLEKFHLADWLVNLLLRCHSFIVAVARL